MIKSTSFLLKLSGSILSLVLLTTSIASAQPLDKIAVVVNNDVIMLSQVYQFTRQMRADPKSKDFSEKTLIKKAIEQLIQRKLQLQKAKEIGLTVDDSTLNLSIQALAQKNNLNMQQFQAALIREGLNFVSFRERVRENMTLKELQKRQYRQNTHITKQQVNDLIANESGRISQGVDFKVQQIDFSAPSGTPLSRILEVQSQANALRSKLINAPSAEFSKHAKATQWKPSSTYSRSELRTLSLLEKGQISNVFQDPMGFHMIKLIDKRGVKQRFLHEYHVRHILISTKTKDARNKLTQIYHKIRAGADFASMAKKHSQDPGSRIQGGDLGWSTSDKYVPQFAKVIQSMPLRKVSQPFKSQYGWHILQVLEHKKSNRTEDMLRQQAKSIINQKKVRKAYKRWVRQLRNDAFIEYRI
ncbi:MAG: peptidylprolyl isomerase [Thiotrichaceae bacterium]|nr:peptidylprolyl isomerase [Thiotrichaceae bacterium]